MERKLETCITMQVVLTFWKVAPTILLGKEFLQGDFPTFYLAVSVLETTFCDERLLMLEISATRRQTYSVCCWLVINVILATAVYQDNVCSCFDCKPFYVSLCVNYFPGVSGCNALFETICRQHSILY